MCHNRDYLRILWSRYREWPSWPGSMPCHCLLPVSRLSNQIRHGCPTDMDKCQRYSKDPSVYLFVANIHFSLFLCRQEVALGQIRSISFRLYMREFKLKCWQSSFIRLRPLNIVTWLFLRTLLCRHRMVSYFLSATLLRVVSRCSSDRSISQCSTC